MRVARPSALKPAIFVICSFRSLISLGGGSQTDWGGPDS